MAKRASRTAAAKWGVPADSLLMVGREEAGAAKSALLDMSAKLIADESAAAMQTWERMASAPTADAFWAEEFRHMIESGLRFWGYWARLGTLGPALCGPMPGGSTQVEPA